MIFVDSNVPMYLIGAAHPHRDDARRLLEQAVIERERLVVDVEVLQEILHRYVAIHRTEHIQPAFDSVLALVDEVFAVELEDVTRAKAIVLDAPTISARDAIHVAVMQRYGVDRIMSFDRGFDAIAGIRRVGA